MKNIKETIKIKPGSMEKIRGGQIQVDDTIRFGPLNLQITVVNGIDNATNSHEIVHPS